MFKKRSVVQILYLDIKSKDLYTKRPLLGANDLIYTGGDKIYISSDVLRKFKLENEIPLLYGHKNKSLKLGYVDNIKFDSRNKILLGDINVFERWNEFVLRKFAEGINGLSTEFKSFEKNERYFNKVMDLTLNAVAIVDKPASRIARTY